MQIAHRTDAHVLHRRIYLRLFQIGSDSSLMNCWHTATDYKEVKYNLINQIAKQI